MKLHQNMRKYLRFTDSWQEDKKLINFDIIVDFDADCNKVKEKIYNEIKAEHPEFEQFIIDDYDISD